ncbi:hypothetical protein [Rhizobium sp. RAF56]|jgi:hypothetical protein|uniref:hypothetical protein n=1 Tax=Rhizobium sp. RAF56 TaxID=3233062 RepID=UPI003F9CA65E
MLGATTALDRATRNFGERTSLSSGEGNAADLFAFDEQSRGGRVATGIASATAECCQTQVDSRVNDTTTLSALYLIL